MKRLSPLHVALLGAAIAALAVLSPALAAIAAVPFIFAVTRSRNATMIVAVIATIVVLQAPASAIALAAPDANLQWLKDLGDKVKLAFQLLAVALVALSIGWAGLHFTRHRDQWMQSIEMLIGGIVGAAIVFHVDTLVNLAAAGALVK
jgi:hypothetical protein